MIAVSSSAVSEIDSINGMFKKTQTFMNHLNLLYCVLFTAALGSSNVLNLKRDYPEMKFLITAK